MGIGADEFACEELTHPLDWTFDGIVDLADLAVFTDAWLSSDPNEPGITTDPGDMGQSNYRDPSALARWNWRCNFDGDYDIDLNDWAYFAYYWRWRACWRDSGSGVWALGENVMMETAALTQAETLSIAQPVIAAQNTQVSQPTIEEEYAQAKEIVEWLEDLWKNDAEARKVIDRKDWKKFMDAIYAWIANFEEQL